MEQLIASAFSGYAIDADTARWVAGRNPKLADKLARVGLIAKRQNSVTAKLGEFLAEYLATRTDIKPSTRRHLEQARAKLIEFLGPEKQLAAVTPGDADEFRLHLMGQVGDNTSRPNVRTGKAVLSGGAPEAVDFRESIRRHEGLWSAA